MGGIAIDEFGDPLPPATLEACRQADAVILGAVGGPKWDDPTAKTRPEAGLLAIRQELGCSPTCARSRRTATARRCVAAAARDSSTGVDILFVRELTGGIYFGESASSEDGGIGLVAP